MKPKAKKKETNENNQKTQIEKGKKCEQQKPFGLSIEFVEWINLNAAK